jgi:hypothetical protein
LPSRSRDRALMMRVVPTLAVGLSALALNCPAAQAAISATTANAVPVVPWARITAPNGRNTDEVSAVRTPDGALHLVWVNGGPGATEDLHQTVLSSTGQVGATTTIVKGWSAIANPAIVRQANGALAVVAGATRSDRTTDPILNQALWISQNDGAGWTLDPGDISLDSGGADPVSATVGPDGSTLFATWSTTEGVFVHRGADPKVAPHTFQAGPGCCGYDPGIALGPSALAPVVGWYSNVTNHAGIYAQRVNPSSGAPVGVATLLPGSATTRGGQLQAVSPEARTPVVARPGGGVYLAAVGGYPMPQRVLVWKYPVPSAAVVGLEPSGASDATLAADPEGRLWAIWASGRGGQPVIHARRSNPAATVWGAEVSVLSPPGSTELWKLDGYAQPGVIDVLAAVSTAGSLATWHAQLKPGLTLTSATSGEPRALTVRVTDAGVPVAGATVGAGGLVARTNAAGQARIDLPHSKVATLVRATATNPGYVSATVVARVQAG